MHKPEQAFRVSFTATELLIEIFDAGIEKGPDHSPRHG